MNSRCVYGLEMSALGYRQAYIQVTEHRDA